MLGHLSLALAALLSFATACIHALGLPMASPWGEGLAHQEHLAICLMWAHASVSWGVVALLWAVTDWRRWQPGPAALAALIPIHAAAGMIYIEPSFFGGHMLAGSVMLAVAGLLLMRRQPRTAS